MLPHAMRRIPPLVIVRDSEFISWDSDCDPHLWLTPDNMRLSTAFVIYDVDGNLHNHYGSIFDNNGYKLAESMLLTALISYLHDEAPDYEQNLNMLLMVLKYIDIEKDEEGHRYEHAIDRLIDNKEADDPYHLSVQQYRKFDDMTGNDPENVIASCIARLSMFGTDEMSSFLGVDELYFDEFYSSKTVLFVTPGKTDTQINFIIPLLYSQLYEVLSESNTIPSSGNSHEYEWE